MAKPTPIRSEERTIDHFQVEPQVFDRLVGFLGKQPIEVAMGLFQDLVNTSTPVFEDELPPPEDPPALGPLEGEGKIVDDPIHHDWDFSIAAGVWICSQCDELVEGNMNDRPEPGECPGPTLANSDVEGAE